MGEYINIGSSCCGRDRRPALGITVSEERWLWEDEHKNTKDEIKFCFANNIKVICNIDSYREGARLYLTLEQWQNWTNDICNWLIQNGATKSNCIITYDNESLEYDTSDWGYVNRLGAVKSGVNGRFEIGAGNNQLPIAKRYNFYEHLCSRKDLFNVLHIHLQDGWTDALIYFTNLKKEYGITRVSCTEGNNFQHLPEDMNHIYEQIEVAKQLNCEDYCFINVDVTNINIADESILYNGELKDQSHEQAWQQFLNVVKANTRPIEEEKEMEFDELYYEGRPQNKYVRDPKGYGIMFLNLVFLDKHSCTFGNDLTVAVKNYQQVNGLKVDGMVGVNTFGALLAKPENFNKFSTTHGYWTLNREMPS